MREKERRKPAFMAWLPARVRYDQELPASAKLLFAEISAMTDNTGYCWATNEYFCSLYAISERTVRDLISKLVKRGYLVNEVIRNEKNEVVERRLWLAEDFRRWAADSDLPPPDYAESSGEKMPHPSGEKMPHPSGEKMPHPSGENLPVERIDTKNVYIPPIVPHEGDGGEALKKRQRGAKQNPRWKPERFEKFWAAFPRGSSNELMKRSDAVRAWDKLKADDAMLDRMAELLRRQSATEMWQQGRGIPYASTWLNSVRRNGIEMPEVRGQVPAGMEGVRGAYRL